MEQKNTRKFVGTFSEVANFIQSVTQLFYNHLKDSQDPYWQWLLSIRQLILNFLITC